MLAIEFQFLAGRYHANPWGRNVNEGEVEWPPSPYRFARALVDAWKRRKPEWPEKRILPLIKALSNSPRFSLPPATASHTRAFLSSNERDPTKKQLVFDAFVAVDRKAKVIMGIDADLSSDSKKDLGTLLEQFNFYGRSESWIRVKPMDDASGVDWNCAPASEEDHNRQSEAVRVACLLPPEQYDNLPNRPESTDWLQAICMTTRDILSEGWSDPPVLCWTDYVRNEDALRPIQEKRLSPFRARFRCAKYALQSTVLPRVQETVSFAERIRAKLMGIHKRINDGDPSRVSSRFSGKQPDGRPVKGHKHAFYLPVDENGDGRLDHLFVFASDPFDSSELSALDRLRSTWQPKGLPDVNLVLISLSADIPGQNSSRWVSSTPFVTSRHYRKGRGDFDEWLTGEAIKECAFHGLPEPSQVEWISHTATTQHPIRWFEFNRSRKKEKPHPGYGCILSFDQPVNGPFALGSGCHFGLGLFGPYEKR